MESRKEIASAKFKDGYSCSQAVFYGMVDKLDINLESALKVACGFGGGMGKNQEVCGAVSGGIMALGMVYGRGENDTPDAKTLTYEKVREFMKLFNERFGAIKCIDLLDGCNMLTEEGKARFEQEDLSNRVCLKCVEGAVEILEGMLG